MRLNYVPLHSILVTRAVDESKPDGETKQVDALAEYKRTGKAFKFTADEVKEITAAFDGQVELALRVPSDEAQVDTETVKTQPATSSDPTQTDAARAAEEAAAKQAEAEAAKQAADKVAAEKAEKAAKAAADKAAKAAKDTDL